MRNQEAKLVLVSFLGLFLELSLIRWLPAYLFSIAFFSNVVLIASFLGLGLGLLLTHNEHDFFDFFTYILAVSVCLVLLLKNVQVVLPAEAKTWIWSYYGGNRLNGVSYLKVSITQLIGIIFTLTVAIFVPVGQKIGKLMKEFEPLYAYTLNIFGSLLGVVGFGILALFFVPAYSWFIAVGLVVILVTYRKKRFFINLFIMLSVVIVIALVEKEIIWSPYYAINLRLDPDKSLSVYVNLLFHQKAVNFEKDKQTFEKFMAPYRWFQPKRVLIIGAGTGNDVWAAQKSGAEFIDAVEIDPMIIILGRDAHPQSPYKSDKVRVFVDDARSFMHKAREKYDMVVYGTLDSHATLSATSSIRLDNYLYTQEAFQDARQLLSPEGTVVLLFSVPTDWIAKRLIETARSVFGARDTRYLITDSHLFNFMIVAGPGVKRALLEKPALSNILLPLPAVYRTPLPKDNWPYLYLAERSIPHLYLATLIVLICISFVSIFAFTPLKATKIDPLFFFLGCGFLLLETKSVTTFSLLFGSTWLVNAVVFSSILSIALLANWIVSARQLREPRWYFAGLILSLLFVYIFPLSVLLKFGFFSKIFLAGALIALPILFSSFVFAIIIKKTKDVGTALGSNLLGAVLGGFLEYSSMIWGLNVLYIIALGCYLVAAANLIKNRSILVNQNL